MRKILWNLLRYLILPFPSRRRTDIFLFARPGAGDNNCNDNCDIIFTVSSFCNNAGHLFSHDCPIKTAAEAVAQYICLSSLLSLNLGQDCRSRRHVSLPASSPGDAALSPDFRSEPRPQSRQDQKPRLDVRQKTM